MLEGRKAAIRHFVFLVFLVEKDEFTHGNVSIITDKDILLVYRIGQPILFTHRIVRCCFCLVLIWTGERDSIKTKI